MLSVEKQHLQHLYEPVKVSVPIGLRPLHGTVKLKSLDVTRYETPSHIRRFPAIVISHADIYAHAHHALFRPLFCYLYIRYDIFNYI